MLLLENLISSDTTAQLRERALSLAAADQKVGKSHTFLANSIAQRVWYLVDKDELQICGPRGSVLIVNGAIWHGSSANKTDTPRVGLLDFFCRPILKPQQARLNVVSDTVISRATPTLKRLLGYPI